MQLEKALSSSTQLWCYPSFVQEVEQVTSQGLSQNHFLWLHWNLYDQTFVINWWFRTRTDWKGNVGVPTSYVSQRAGPHTDTVREQKHWIQQESYFCQELVIA